MPRPRDRYLHRYKTRHGKFYWYVRKPGQGRIRIRGEFGTPEFLEQVDAALAGTPIVRKRKHKAVSGTVKWLWEKYRESTSWTVLSAATRRQRENIMVGVLASIGAEPYAAIQRADIVASRDKRASTPAQARNFLDCMRGLFRWAFEAEYVSVDPTAGVKNPARPPGEGFPVWTEEDVEAYQKRWPLGTKERIWLDVLLYTGLRRGDATRLGRQHVRDGIATLRTEKSQDEVTVTIPILPVLAKTLKAGPTGDLAFICGDKGDALTKESFGNFFRAACRAAGVNKSAHGVRKIAATTAANNGATVAQLEAIFGWQGGQMASLYTKTANRRRLSVEAMHMLNRTAEEHSMCQPSGKVGTPGQKT
jgi:integrase